jgi:putative PIN family toxin of toxin-antitoxin system
MASHPIVIDTNVLIAALRSSDGASYRLLNLLEHRPEIELHLSVPLVLEYEETAKRQAEELGLSLSDIDDVLDYLCSVAVLHDIFFLWRPHLRDPRDDMVLELAVSGGGLRIISYNKRDFVGASAFGVGVETAREFLVRIGELK